MTLDVEAAPASVRPEPTTEGAPPAALDRIERVVTEACARLDGVSADKVLAEARRGLYPGIPDSEVELALIMAARSYVEVDPDYSYVAARLLLDKLRSEALSFVSGVPEAATQTDMSERYATYLPAYVSRGIDLGQLDPALAKFDLGRLGKALHADRDEQFTFLGLQTLYDRYFLHSDGTRYELPQAFFMRVAMGLALNEDDREARAIEFYELLSSFDFMASTPTLFNSGTVRAQLSSCFLTTIGDDLQQIFHGISNNAMLSKYSGGLGNDWTPVRGLGSHIKGTNGKSQGVVPFLKIANDTAVAVNQGGKRKGAVCAYLETWHIDIEEFLDLRKNTGDERRRTHDMNTANWVPDLFMQRVEQDGQWTLFSPNEVPELHDLYGTAFAEAYAAYEKAADEGRVKVFKRVRAVDLWRRMLTMLFETGHPWITFKDPSNLRSPQQHVGVVHSSNLCTEITLNTNSEEVAVCNLGSVNLAQHTGPDGIDVERLRRTVRTAVRMLDNVIDVNFYTIPEAERANMRHRPVGLGLMGFQDALFKLRLPYSSQGAVEFADESMELISYHAIEASVELAAERGAYESFEGSLWSQGILPIDSVRLLAKERGGDLDMDRGQTLDWFSLREKVKKTGMRNSNVMAIAPTATIANITGVNQSIEPVYRNLFVKSNMSGDFTVANDYLVRDLKARGLWDEDMVSQLKLHDGSLGRIDRVPDDLKALYATAFEVDPDWLVDAGARRQKWIDQAQSLNLYMAAPSGKKLDALYRRAWRSGLKTTYYLRSQSATHVEKSTIKGTDGRLNAVSATPVAPAPAPVPVPAPVPAPAPVAAERPAPVAEPVEDEFEIVEGQACSIDDPECEACQ
ncbi:ribonucleoside-diphosphate reductase alpha chain [Nocardiopsis flavescens]|uniref:Vitamin B12-dependent ribonucleotide reductase n=1 Tax=Nocardiopsis flavescens TaxID=758803 RepID=A0A1M6M0E0_9ACTN|nr:ribonucleoside-diphosphate reductase subunit alpha [Nocardiopsis flavescens]SHJ76915.1 ribonucleoside-diphosphate reductase alpha chain [Nocardiopsis flavescens]